MPPRATTNPVARGPFSASPTLRTDPAGILPDAWGNTLYRLMDPQPGPNRSASRAFVGRDGELAELLAGLEDAIAGHGRLFLVAGEPGIGKSMLAEQLALRGQERGVRVLWGRCWEGGGAPAYWPWIQLLRPLVETPEGGRAADAGPEAADLAALFPELAVASAVGPGLDLAAPSAAARFRLFAAIGTLLERASSRQPLLLVLDDLHAADPASLLLLRFVARDLRGKRLLLLATYRDLEARRQSDFAEAVGELVREGLTIRLRGLAPAEVRQLVESLIGASASDDDLSRICDATGGNPLFIRETVRLARGERRPGWHGHPAVSEGVRSVIHRRLASLDADTVRVLSVAAVVGQDFDAPLVGLVSGFDLVHVLQSLAQAERSELIVRATGPTTAFRFFHGLMREVLYGDLPIGLRRELHARVGTAIERLHASDLASRLGELAYHFGQVGGGEAARAGEYARKAGDQAMASFAYEEAAAQYQRALEALRFAGPDEALRCELLLRLGGARARAGDYQEAKASFLHAAAVARRLDAPEQLARAALGFGEPQVEGGLVDQQLLALLREALDRLSPDDSALRARLLARVSLELTFSDDERLRESHRDALSREALAMARRLGDVSALAIACRARWLAVWGPDGLEERSALSEEILGLARETGDREMELVGRARRLTCSFEFGNLPAVEADLAAHARLAGELRMRYHEWTAATVRAGRVLLDSSLALAEELVEAAPALLPGRQNARLAYLNQITPIRWEQGRLAELRDAWQGIAESFPQAGFARGWLALACADIGQPDEAARQLHSLVDDAPALPRGGLWLPVLAVAALATARLDDREAAARLYPLLVPYADRTIVIPMPHPVMSYGSAAFYLGLLAATRSRWDEAGDHFESALRANARLGARAFLARTRYEYARMLLRRGRAEDRDRALALLDQAEETARALGLTVTGEGCARLGQLTIEPARAAAPPEPAAALAPGAKNLFRREGDYWTVVYQGSLVRLRDSLGLRYLARLLASPGQELHAIDLEGEQARDAPARQGLAPSAALDELAARPDLGDAGELLDARAKAEYRARLGDLRADLDEAERFNDPERAARIRAEIDFIATELARALGLGGRDRRAASHAERARLNVTRAIKAALASLERHHPALGQHLRSTIRTGRYCSYTPDPRVPIAWQL